jgi:hypothetical protein
MKVDIISIEDKGNLSKETIWFDVLEDADLKYYLVCDTTYTDEHQISNELRHVYWFPSTKVKKNDYVALCTRDGTNSTTSNKRNTTTHIFYWDLGRTVWNKDGDCAVLFEINTWKTKRG